LEEAYVEQPKGFTKKGEEKSICRWINSLHGMKQAPRAWYTKIDQYLRSSSFNWSNWYPKFYVKLKDGNIDIMFDYVDDLIIIWNNSKLIEEEKANLNKTFEIANLSF
jgi:hypothetical protein